MQSKKERQRASERESNDVAVSLDHPCPAHLPIAVVVAEPNELVDFVICQVFVDGEIRVVQVRRP